MDIECPYIQRAGSLDSALQSISTSFSFMDVSSDLYFCYFAGKAAVPVLDYPIGVFRRPLSHRELTVCEALTLRKSLRIKVQRNVLATGRLVNHTNQKDQFNHIKAPFLDTFSKDQKLRCREKSTFIEPSLHLPYTRHFVCKVPELSTA